MPGNWVISNVSWVVALLWASLPWAASGASVRKPLGVHVHVDIGDAIGSYPGSKPTLAQLHSYLQSLYASLLADRAISRITLGAHYAVDPVPCGLAGLLCVDATKFEPQENVFEDGFPGQQGILLEHTPGFAVDPGVRARQIFWVNLAPRLPRRNLGL